MAEQEKGTHSPHAAGGEPLSLKLYVAGQSPSSLRAVDNLRHILEKYAPHAEVEVIDIYQQQELTKSANLIGAPTLDKMHPLPVQRMMGDLSDEHRVVVGLSLADE